MRLLGLNLSGKTGFSILGMTFNMASLEDCGRFPFRMALFTRQHKIFVYNWEKDS